MMKIILSPVTVRTKADMIPNNAIRMQSLVTLSYYLILLIFIANSADLAANETDEWQLQIDKQDVQVYSRKTDSGYIEVKAVTNIKALPKDLLALLENVAIARQWIDNSERVELIDSPTADERIVHSFFAAPWPVKDRDMVTHSKTVFEQSGIVNIVVSDYSNHYPATNAYVRMANVSGKWTMQPTGSKQMKVIYQGSGEPSGNLPIWLANNLVKSSTYNTFKQMRMMLERN